MKPVYSMELLMNDLNKKVFVYKLEQIDIIRRNLDARDLAQGILKRLYVDIYIYE